MFCARTFLAAASLLTSALLATAAAAQGTGRWTKGAAMPSERSEIAVAEAGGKFYVLGGYRGEMESGIYDPAADGWSRGAAIPRAVHHAGAVGLNGKIYLIGGYVDGWNSRPTRSTNTTRRPTSGVYVRPCRRRAARWRRHRSTARSTR